MLSVPKIPFSPHTRGCSAGLVHCVRVVPVFPAYAGMFRPTPGCRKPHRSFPRIRGDVPIRGLAFDIHRWFSPHTRGCSDYYPIGGILTVVFPAYAGMFPTPGARQQPAAGFPRIRGDVPCVGLVAATRDGFSPHTRGCSGAAPACFPGKEVFPAYAGMFLRMRRTAG